MSDWSVRRDEALRAVHDKCIERCLPDDEWPVDPTWALVFMMFEIRQEISDLRESFEERVGG